MSDIKNNMKELRSQVSTWQKSTEGNRRATLLTKHNKHRNQIANGENVSNAPTPAEHNEFEKLHQKWLDIKNLAMMPQKNKQRFRLNWSLFAVKEK